MCVASLQMMTDSLSGRRGRKAPVGLWHEGIHAKWEELWIWSRMLHQMHRMLQSGYNTWMDTTFRDQTSVHRPNHNTRSLKTRIPHGEYTIIMPVFPSFGNHVSNRTTAPTFFFLSLPGSCHPIIHLHPNHTQIDGISIQASLTSCHSLWLGVILRIHINIHDSFH